MTNRTAGQTLLLVLGTVLLVGGLGCVVVGFADLASSDAGAGTGS
jgi:hypothetical protein